VGRGYILGGTNIRLGELIDCLRDLTGISMPRRRIPYWLALAVAAVAEVTADLVTGRRPAAPLAGVRLARYLWPSTARGRDASSGGRGSDRA
jgi:dihydroflavonol-4-reductase